MVDSPFLSGRRYEVNPARPADLPACGELLPIVRASGEPCHWGVARDVLSRQIVGAIALGSELFATPVAGPRVAVRVAERVRRRGIGRQLIEYAAGLPHPPAVNALHAWDLINPVDERARAWGWLGFVVGEVMVRHEIDLVGSLNKMEAIYAQLIERGDIPPGAKVEPMGPQHVPAVAELNADYLGSSRERILANFADPARRNYDPAVSAVLLLDGRVMGFSMGRRADDDAAVCFWDANVLHPAVRVGWANLMLKTEVGRQAKAAGVRTLRYCTLPRHRDSRKHTRQVGGREIERLVRLVRPIRGGVIPPVDDDAVAVAAAPPPRG